MHANSRWVHLLLQILYGLVCLVGLVGNTLVIYVVSRYSNMRSNVTNLFLLNLAIADTLFLLGIPFLMVTASLGSWPLGNPACKAYLTSTSINQITSSMFLLVMSAARYLAICHPLRALKWRRSPLLVAKLVALSAWILSGLLMVPVFMYAHTVQVDESIVCNIFWPASGGWIGEQVFLLYSLILSFAIPLCLIIIFYGLIIRKLRRSVTGTQLRGGPPESTASSGTTGTGVNCNCNNIAITPQETNRERKKSKATKLVLTVIIVYFLCWAPYWTTQLVLVFVPQSAPLSGVKLSRFMFSGILSYSNSAKMNPIIYSFLSDNFRQSFLMAFTTTCARRAHQSRDM